MNKHLIFYDGNCGLCHAWVNFVIRFDKAAKFNFSPLQGDTINSMLSAEIRRALPDSIIVLSDQKNLYLKSKAIEFILSEIGGVFKASSKIIGVFPENLNNLSYDFVAKIRKKVFGVKDDLCPILPDNLRSRFLP